MQVGDFAAQVTNPNSSFLQDQSFNNSENEDHLTKLDQLLNQEEMQTGKKVFKRG